MSEIVWGEPIKVNGKRPEWLGEDELILCNGPRNASLNLWPATTSFRLPADHPHYAKGDDWTPDERTIRRCIEVLPEADDGRGGAWIERINALNEAHAALAALLSKPDNDRALAEKIVSEEFPNAASENEWALIKVALAGIRAGRIK